MIMKEKLQTLWSFISKHPYYGLVLWIFVLHRPAILHFGNAIPGSQQGDTIRGHWSAWLMSVDATPLNSTFFNWPDGGSLLPLPPISLWLISPITSLFGAAVGLSALILLHTILLAFSGYLLGRSVEMEQKPSIAMALLITTIPMLGECLYGGVYEYLTLGWLILCFSSLIYAARGHSVFWGMGAGLFYVISMIECGYWASAGVLGVLALICIFIRSLKGFLGIVVSGLVVVALSYGYWLVVKDVFGGFLEKSWQGTRVIMGSMELLSAIPGIEPPPPPPGQPEPFQSAPSLFFWVCFFIGSASNLRKTWWMFLLSGVYLLISMDSSIMHFYMRSDFGAFALNTRRYSAVMYVFMMLAIIQGFATLHRKFDVHQYRRWILGSLALSFGILIVSNSKNLLFQYPLLWTPQTPSFAKQIYEDPIQGSVIVYPQERTDKQRRGQKHSGHTYLSSSLNFSNPQARLWFQTLINRPMHHTSKLSTLQKNGRGLQLKRKIQQNEIRILVSKGLRYVLIDYSALTKGEVKKIAQMLQREGFGCQYFDEWDGIEVCRQSDR
jgi:hypothetical protein